MAVIPTGQKFHTVNESVDTKDRGSAIAQTGRESYTMQDIIDTVPVPEGGVSSIIAGDNITISPAGGTGAVTVNAESGGGPAVYELNPSASNAIQPDGGGNTASGTDSVISGGSFNSASANTSGVHGGTQNNATGTRSFVGGGNNNSASGTNSIIIGGQGNVANQSNSMVIGGTNNAVLASGSSVLAGSGNIVFLADAHCIGSGLNINRSNCLFVNNISISSIATSPAGLSSGNVWNNNGVLNIV